MLQAKLYQMSNTIKIRLHHLHRFLAEEVGTGISCCMDDKVYTLRRQTMSLTLFVHRPRNIHLDKAKVGLVPVSSKLIWHAACRPATTL